MSMLAWEDFGGQRDLLPLAQHGSVCEWARKHFHLSRSYAAQGHFEPYPWQVEPLESPRNYDRVTYIAPVQTGKSLMCEVILGYMIDCEPVNMMCVYAKGETVRDVFDERLKPLIAETPRLCAYWDGDPDNLTKRRIKLRHMVARVASANARSDLASHPAGFVYGDELAKWPRTKGYNPIKLLQGRKHAVRMLGKHTRELFCTSPIDDQDYSYQLSHEHGTLFLRPHYRCPHCGHWQTLRDSQIVELPNRKGAKDHSPGRIRETGAAEYHCEQCKHVITEDERAEMAQCVVWAEVHPKTGKTIEDIVSDKHGGYRVRARKDAQYVVYNWNRLVDVTWTFAECLATYYDALRSSDGHTLADYRNEDMADWISTKGSRFADGYIGKRARHSKYWQYGPRANVPDEVIAALVGMDTQDNGFYYVIRGFGKGGESWLLRHGFIECAMDAGIYASPQDVGLHVNRQILNPPLKRKNGSELRPLFGLIDRGGHRSDDVDAICRLSGGLFMPYIGATSVSARLVELRTGKGQAFYYCNSEQLSRTVETQLQQEQMWHVPNDVGSDYCGQVLNQFEQVYTDTRGNERKRWVTGDDIGKPDHYRDCENMIVAGMHARQLNEMLHSDVGQAAIEAQTEAASGVDEMEFPDRFTVNGMSGSEWDGFM